MCALASGVMVTQAMTLSSLNHALDEMLVTTHTTPDIVQQHCPQFYSESSNVSVDEQLYWDGKLILSMRHAFFLGFLIAPVPAGLAADLYGARYVCATSLVLHAACVFLLPSLAIANPQFTLPALLLLGISNGMAIPCMSVLAAHWSPDIERCTFFSFICCGNYIGWIIVEFLHEYWRGWGNYSWIYASGVLALSWCALWLLFYYDRPVYHPHISREEHIWINTHTPGIPHGFREVNIWNLYSPWKYIFSSVPFLAFLSITFGSSWAEHVLLHQVSRYLKNVLNVESNWWFSAAGQTVSCLVVSALVHAVMCDRLVRHEYMSATASRRGFAVLSTWLPMPFIMSVTFWMCNVLAVLVTLTVALYFYGVGRGVLYANTVDLSPRHCGVLSGFAGAVYVITRLVTREISGHLIKQDIGSPPAWTGVFWVTGIIMLVTSLPYACLGSAQIQPWNELPTRERFSSMLSRLRASQGGRETITIVATNYLDNQPTRQSHVEERVNNTNEQ